MLLNISLGIDIFNNYTKQSLQAKTFDLKESVDDLLEKEQPITLPALKETEYLEVIEGKNNYGETLLAVRDCFYFESNERNYYAHNDKGVFKITKSITALETELDPVHFFRSNRNNIVNLNYFDQYTYWEKGKYILQSTKNNKLELTMPRARLQNYKSALEINRKQQLELKL